MLRHRPDEFGVEVDAQGYADLDAVVKALQDRDADLSLKDVESVVFDSEKKRFEIIDGRIRARYGREGLEAGDRQYVHLSFEAEVAGQLGGGRRRVPSVVIRVNALAAHKAGVLFYDCGPTILAPRVPVEYVSVDESSAGWEDERETESPRSPRMVSEPVGPSPEPAAEAEPVKPAFGRSRRFKTRR
jgi:putative RNA 2'-phosphotransferase